jgi:hypothetical protein
MSNGCETRKITGFLRPKDPRIKALKEALQNTTLRGQNLYEFVKESSECLLSFPDSDWYAISGLTDKNGNSAVFYFKVQESEEDFVCSPAPYRLFERPPELGDRTNCVVSNKKCVNPDSGGSSSRTRAPVKSKKVKIELDEETREVATPEIAKKLSKLVIAGDTTTTSSSRPSGPKTTITREYFEQLKSKDMIIDWMIKNMNREDLIKCVRKQPVLEPVQTVVTPPSKVSTQTLKKVTKEELVSQIKSIPESEEEQYGVRSRNIVKLCKKANVEGSDALTVQKSKKGVWEIFRNGKIVDDMKLLDKCADMEAKWLRRRLAVVTGSKQLVQQRLTGTGGKERLMVVYKKGDIPASELTNVRTFFPQIDGLTTQGGFVVGRIPSSFDRETGKFKYYPLDTIDSNDLVKLDKRLGKTPM